VCNRFTRREQVSLENKNKCGLTIAVGIITSIITVVSLAIGVFMILDKKRKREEKELEEYLESTIS
jgi:hypothetical protein